MLTLWGPSSWSRPGPGCCRCCTVWRNSSWFSTRSSNKEWFLEHSCIIEDDKIQIQNTKKTLSTGN